MIREAPQNATSVFGDPAGLIDKETRELNVSKKWGSVQSGGREKVAESPINNLRITYESPKNHLRFIGKNSGFFDKLVERDIESPTRKAREIL